MKQIYIMRHSKSDWTGSIVDFERPLNERGKTEAVQMGKWLNNKKLKPELVISSPAKRAKKTAKRLCETIGISEEKIIWNEKFYYQDEFSYINTLKDLHNSISSVLLIGHNPNVENAIKKLITNHSEMKEVKTSTIAAIQADISSWNELQFNRNTLEFIVYPVDARKDLGI